MRNSTVARGPLDIGLHTRTLLGGYVKKYSLESYQLESYIKRCHHAKGQARKSCTPGSVYHAPGGLGMHGKKMPLVVGWRVYKRQPGGDRQTSEEASAGVRVRVHESLNPGMGEEGQMGEVF